MKIRRLLAGIGIAVIAAVGVSVGHSTPVAARGCNTNWTTIQGNNGAYSWTALRSYNSVAGLTYRETPDGGGGCLIQYGEYFGTDHYANYNFGFRAWVCGSYRSDLSADGFASSTTSVGWGYSSWIEYGNCYAQADNYQLSNVHSNWAPPDGALGWTDFAYLHF